jgi:hypothetical protein
MDRKLLAVTLTIFAYFAAKKNRKHFARTTRGRNAT